MGNKYNRPADRKASAADVGELNEKVVSIARVAKVVKGGRRFSFSALVVVGDGKGNVGCGLGKANEVPDCISKGGDLARKRMIKAPIIDGTIPHSVIGRSGSASVMLKPASPGTGVIAGSVVRSVLERVGIKDVLTKAYGSRNPHNLLAATFDALLKLETKDQVLFRRGIKDSDVSYSVRQVSSN